MSFCAPTTIARTRIFTLSLPARRNASPLPLWNIAAAAANFVLPCMSLVLPGSQSTFALQEPVYAFPEVFSSCVSLFGLHLGAGSEAQAQKPAGSDTRRCRMINDDVIDPCLRWHAR